MTPHDFQMMVLGWLTGNALIGLAVGAFIVFVYEPQVKREIAEKRRGWPA